jgi:chemotaxis protein methyltransferase CheR
LISARHEAHCQLHRSVRKAGAGLADGGKHEATVRVVTAAAPGLAAAPGDADVMSTRNFNRLASLIQDYCGIKMPEAKRTMMAVRLRRRLVARQLADLDAYCDFLFEDGGLETELVHLINAVSTNKTDFFRESAHFDFMWNTALPAFAKAGRRQIKLWSAAASIGAEAYSAAMVMQEFRRQKRGPEFSIVATDISTEVLDVAVIGRFPQSMMDPVPADLYARYVLQALDPGLDEVRIVPELRTKIAWGRLNLMDRSSPIGRDMDLILCRNILIYFNKPTQDEVLARLTSHLVPGGYLILGHAEASAAAKLGLTQIANTIYQKI